MKLNTTLLLLASLAAAPLLSAQDPAPTTATPRAETDYGPRRGEREFTIGGSGVANRDLDNSMGGVDFSIGQYLNDTLAVTIRQGVSYSNGAGGGADFDGSTFVALDQHFGTTRWRPFLGVNFGGLYGERTSDTWAAGLEGGVKYYIQPKTFVAAMVNYAWTFNDSDGATDNFDDGAFLWSVGVGFNF